MMKSRIVLGLVIALIILVLGILWSFRSTTDRKSTQVFPATINRDCAPWDGSAFTVSIRYDPKTTITISIWQSPNFTFPVTFSFPDETGQVGFAYILSELDPLIPMNGEVFFQRVELGMPIEGEFKLMSGRGEQFEGIFRAEWGDQTAMCG